jgi:hypothetical protein
LELDLESEEDEEEEDEEIAESPLPVSYTRLAWVKEALPEVSCQETVTNTRLYINCEVELLAQEIQVDTV